ncbi:hypothetical protein AC1031_005890 [Aphanomyces cochlioides]|nr:hypothetical protein AC1031_005890 [Aphanomyces cochlioides]
MSQHVSRSEQIGRARTENDAIIASILGETSRPKRKVASSSFAPKPQKKRGLFALILEFLIPTWKVVPAINREYASRNKAYMEDASNDSLMNSNPLRIRLAMSIERGMNQLKMVQNNLKMPVQIFHGDADKLTSPISSKQFFDAIPSMQKTYTSLPGQYHCLFDEPEGAATLVATIDWLKAISKL